MKIPMKILIIGCPFASRSPTGYPALTVTGAKAGWPEYESRRAAVSSAGSQHFFEAVPLADKEMRIYPDGYHEPHNDIEHEQVAADLEGWLEQHL